MTEWLHFHFSLSCFGEGNGNPLQYSCLQNPRDGRAWWPAIYGVAQSRTRLKWLSSSLIFHMKKSNHQKWISYKSYMQCEQMKLRSKPRNSPEKAGGALSTSAHRMISHDGRGGPTCISSWRNSKLHLLAEQSSAGEYSIPPKKDTPHPRAEQKPQQDGRRGETTYKIKPHTCWERSEGSNKTLCTPGTREPTRD